MPFGHAPNAIELEDGGIFVTWYCATHESCEDQRIAGALLLPLLSSKIRKSYARTYLEGKLHG